jgi:hypothetical protein
MKLDACLRLAGDRDGGAFRAAHVTRRRPSGSSSFFTSLRGTPHHPDQVMSAQFCGCKAQTYPAKDGRYPAPSVSSVAGFARSSPFTYRIRIPAILGAHGGK